MTAEKRIERYVSMGVFFILLITYWLTVPPTVSYWDCPEYVAGAWKLEIGHPPGNPVWMLVERVITMLAPSGRYAALLVNLSSGLFTALAAFLLCRIIFEASVWILARSPRRRMRNLLSALASGIGSLAFGWCDSVWYSAVEAEVYAMSIFFTALCVWVMVKWAETYDRPKSWRLLILLAYLFGLSIGIHQLNLLCIPALSIIWGIKRGLRAWWKFCLIFLLSLAAVGCVLVGMMPSAISLAAEMELLCINTLHLPYLSGVALYVTLLGASLLLAIAVTARSTNRGAVAAGIFPAIFLSGIFVISENFLAGACVSAIVSIIFVRSHIYDRHRLNLCMWMLAMVLTGYSAYAVIPLRGDVKSPANAAMPGEPFSFASYQAREQYGGAPLLYGQTPYSRPLIREDFSKGDSVPDYSKVALLPGHRVMMRKMKGATIHDPYCMLSASDSALNSRVMGLEGDGYVVRGYTARPVLTPELSMWFPRITSRDPRDLKSFEDWVGMVPETMTKVRISEVIDSAGRFNTRLDSSGSRGDPESYRPTYLQNLQMMFGYQIGYMYLRYLMWNFSGRQNDIHSTGEVEHGNFITGFPAVDNAMLGAEDSLPYEAGSGNPGRNSYYMLPLLLGIAGIIWLIRNGRRGQRTCIVTAILFLMTGIAIVVYLNQAPGEPRERDYSFLGSYMAYAVWIGFGAQGIASGAVSAVKRMAAKKPAAKRRQLMRATMLAVCSLMGGIVLLMFAVNYDDHDRSGRRAASTLSANLLNSLEKDAIIFVNGDNYTFPLWYAQEVEGIRKDVRVINISYLTLPQYAASMMLDWDGAKGTPSVFRPEDIIYSAYLFPTIGGNSGDSVVPAAEMIRRLSRDSTFTTCVRSISLKIDEDSVIMPLSRVTNGTETLNFKKLMILNILAANAESGQKRPIYWHRALQRQYMLGIDKYTSPAFAGRRLGRVPPDSIDSEMRRLLPMLKAPNSPGYVYLDGTPAGQISAQRGSLIIMSRELLRRGKRQTALQAAEAAHLLMGDNPRTFGAVSDGDSAFVVKKELGLLFRELADSTGRADLRQRGDSLIADHRRILHEWTRYKRALPASLRSKTAH